MRDKQTNNSNIPPISPNSIFSQFQIISLLAHLLKLLFIQISVPWKLAVAHLMSQVTLPKHLFLRYLTKAVFQSGLMYWAIVITDATVSLLPLANFIVYAELARKLDPDNPR